jgi:hypothetical protein
MFWGGQPRAAPNADGHRRGLEVRSRRKSILHRDLSRSRPPRILQKTVRTLP